MLKNVFFRWAQVTEELRQALWELEEEREKRRHVEEEMELKAHEQDDLKNKFSALMEEKENTNTAVLVEMEAAKTCQLVPADSTAEESDDLVVDQQDEKDTAVPSHQRQNHLQVGFLHMATQTSESAKQPIEPYGGTQLRVCY